MSRKAMAPARQAGGSAAGGVATATATTTATALINAEDMCPVCKTIRYLNKDLEFLINPECYHPMCSNCVNRLFNDGPNQCPYAGCHKTLRRRGFRAAFFGDLTVEREVDIRRRVAAVFNLAEDDFEDLRAYNDYLQKVEELTTSLVSGTDVERRRAEAELQSWRAEHTAAIERNRAAGRAADDAARRRLAAERDAAVRRRRENAQEDADEKQSRVREREAELDGLAAAPAAGSAGGAARIVLKRRGLGRAQQLAHEAAVTARGFAGDEEEAGATPEAGSGIVGSSGAVVGERLSIRGLKDKRKAPAAADEPYDPFGGVDLAPTRFRLRGDYTNAWLAEARHKTSHVAGGYDVRDYTTRAMFEAFAGLGVFIGDEKETGIGTSAKEVATIGAAMAAR